MAGVEWISEGECIEERCSSLERASTDIYEDVIQNDIVLGRRCVSSPA